MAVKDGRTEPPSELRDAIPSQMPIFHDQTELSTLIHENLGKKQPKWAE